MGTKRTNRSIEDFLQLPRSPATPDRGNQSNEWISFEARHQAGPKIQAEQERGGEEWRARGMDRIRDRPREGRRGVEQDLTERERYSQFKSREDEMALKNRDQRREEERYKNGKKYVQYREREKGDTFPKTVKPCNERERRPRYSVDHSSEKLMERGIGKLMEVDMIGIERERARKRDKDTQRYREIERQRECERRKIREEIKQNAGRRSEEEELDRIRWDPGKLERRGERYTDFSDSDQQVIRRQERDRYRDREQRYYSPQTKRVIVGDRENFSDREEIDERRRAVKGRHRCTKSEGDTDGETERAVTRKRDAVLHRIDGRSEVDKEKNRDKLRERERRREVERLKERDKIKEKEPTSGKERNKEWMMKRYREGNIRDKDWVRNDQGPDRPRGTEDGSREKEINERIRKNHERAKASISPAEGEIDIGRQKDNYYEKESSESSSQTQWGTDRKFQEEVQSSKEWIPGSDAEGDNQRRRINSFEEKEGKRASESKGEQRRNEERQDTAYWLKKEEVREGVEKEEIEKVKEKEVEKSESRKRPIRKMWLEPRSERERTESLQEEFEERQQAREKYTQRYKEQNISRGEEEMSSESKNQGVTILMEDSPQELDSTAEFITDVDTQCLEESTVNDETVFDNEAWVDVPWQTDTKHATDDTAEDYSSDKNVYSEGEERTWEDWRDRVTSGEDGFVTVSSGADEDETEEDRFEDCTEFWDDEDRESLARQSPTSTHQIEGEVETRMIKERSDHAVTIFCVVGQTLPRSGANQNPLLDDMEQDKTSQDSSLGHKSPNRDIEAENTNTDNDLILSEANGSSSHDTNCDDAKSDQMIRDVSPSEDSVISSDVNAVEDIEPHQTESFETLTQDEDHENAQIKLTDKEKQRQNEMESSCHLEEAESTEDRKRFSAAPHVKWAKNVLIEILGPNEEPGTFLVPEPNTLTEQTEDGAPAETESQGDTPLYGIVQKPRKHNHDRKCIDPEMHFKPEDTKTNIVLRNENLLHVEGQSEGEEDLERLSTSPDLLSLSSDNETDKEASSKKEKKQKKKAVWKLLGTNSFRELGNEVWGKKVGIRKALQKHNEEEEEGEGVGRDRRTRVFTTDSQLYQQYNEVVQNRELIHQSHSDASSILGDHDVHAISASSSPSHSPTLARRPLPPLPPVIYPQFISNSNIISSGNGLLGKSQRPTSPQLSRTFAASPMLWQDLPGVKNNPELKCLSGDERRLQEVRFEVVTSETSYCSSLDIVVEHFVKCKQLNLLLTSQDKNWLFSKLTDVRAISHSFFSQLEERVESDIMHFTVCDIIIKHCPRFRAVYVPYLTNQSYQDKTYQRLMNENIGFRHIVEKLEQSPKCQRLPLRSFLILPFQRITRLKLLVQMKNIESLVSLNAKVDFECKTLPLISQSRRLVKEGQVTELRDIMSKEKERIAYIHLFNDYLLLSSPKEGGRFTVIDHAPVSELRAENCRVKLHSLQKNLFRLYMGQRVLLLRAETQSDKLRWISALSHPHPEIDFNAAQDIPQMQCIRAFVAQQPDELSLEKADVLLVHQQSSDGWVEGTRLSDRLRGWVPESHLDTIVSEKVRQRNLIDTLKITTATATT
ncbi:Rho guanine nucleotide exchange factor 5 [Bagarius yarrelli]|uniref:Rho guanine nucleotide exchange factor 5 n=1 Tax=Bagarius yarrelli TaxID=175774 RepID=A0A556TQ46_BAGYA|nr:Rho guanine nucleotide exchange factor 5 [Bagarius yarrelli]